ncbi:CapA family protein [Zobellella maritima]|uniref:CapA family protein n=1 Tax=Zobellella maritima TaxID=2059725 RepID=UPI000E30B126|nr:CapA family protein [Zobellella maritima]
MSDSNSISLFLCGDVMTGRGIDQILPHPGVATLHEDYVKTATDYVRLAERKNGAIPSPVGFSYIWGDALAQLARFKPQFRLINLETSITTSDDWQPKGINYRMHPANAPVLTAARIDVCVLANNHILDWGKQGLSDSLRILNRLGISSAGAGASLEEAQAPAICRHEAGRLLVFSMATGTSGVPVEWAAGPNRAGVALLPELSAGTVRLMRALIQRWKQPQDLVIASIHWGGNWGYPVPQAHTEFAHGLLEAGVDLVHGHSSHHILRMELYRGKLIIYGCGDFINDYEGIGDHQCYRGDLPVMFFPRLALDTGNLLSLRLVPLCLQRFRLGNAAPEDARWLQRLLNREGRKTGTYFELLADHSLILRMSADGPASPGFPPG